MRVFPLRVRGKIFFSFYQDFSRAITRVVHDTQLKWGIATEFDGVTLPRGINARHPAGYVTCHATLKDIGAF